MKELSKFSKTVGLNWGDLFAPRHTRVLRMVGGLFLTICLTSVFGNHGYAMSSAFGIAAMGNSLPKSGPDVRVTVPRTPESDNSTTTSVLRNVFQQCRNSAPEGQATFRVRGYVVDKNNKVVPRIALTIRNLSNTLCISRPDKGNFEVYLPAGQYIFNVRDPRGRYNNYQPLTVRSNTSIKFMYFGRQELPPAVTADLRVSRSKIKKGESTVLSWSVNGADDVKLDQSAVQSKGSRSISPASTTKYELVARNSGGVVSDTVTVEVEAPVSPEKPKATFSVTPSKIKKGQAVQVSWSTEGATAVTLDGKGVPLSGTRRIYPKSTGSLTLTAYDSNSGQKTTITRGIAVNTGSGDDSGNRNENRDNTDTNSNTDESNGNADSQDQNQNLNLNTGTVAIPESPQPTPPVDTAETFPSSDFQKILIAILGLALLAGLAWAFPFLAAIPSAISSFLGGLGMIGQTDGSGDEVHCTLFSQPEVNAGTDLLVQVFAHLLEQSEHLDELAQELDPDAKKAISKPLKEKIKRESVLTFKLMVPGIDLDEDEQDIVWRGEPDSVEFIIPIPADHPAGNRFGRVFVYSNGNEIGKIPFRINIVPLAKQLEPEAAQPEVAGVMTQDQTAFVSYASRDKDKVYRFVQLMDVLKYKFHIDIFNIEAGERWEQKLYEFIGTDDVFLLFWSESASQSEWVLKEARLAKERMEKEKLPRIVIYNLDGRADVPEWLQDIHVDRKWAEIIGQIEAQR